MAGVLKSCSVRRDYSAICLLVVASVDLCEKLSDALLEAGKERELRVVVHQCETITEVIRLKPDLSVDFVVFAFDYRVSHTFSEVEENIKLIDEYYIITGCACLVNCAGVPKRISLTFQRSREICKKLNLKFMTVNILDVNNILEFGNRLLNVAETVLGLRIGIPILSRPISHE